MGNSHELQQTAMEVIKRWRVETLKNGTTVYATDRDGWVHGKERAEKLVAKVHELVSKIARPVPLYAVINNRPSIMDELLEPERAVHLEKMSSEFSGDIYALFKDGQIQGFMISHVGTHLRTEPGWHRVSVDLDMLVGEVIETVAKMFNEVTVQRPPYKAMAEDDPTEPTTVKMVVQGPTGPQFFDVGKVREPFEPDNYTPEIQAAFRRLQRMVSDTKPIGRIGLLRGAPGTGKSFLIKSLITHTKKAVWMFVPASMAPSLVSPELFTNLMMEHQSIKEDFGWDDVPLCIVIEDADNNLLKRNPADAAQSAALSTILNLADGLPGEFADVRIIATTNAEKDDLDPAVTRPGRLAEFIEMGPLSPEQASRVYEREAGEAKSYSEPVTLAQIYGDIRKSATS